MEARLGERVGKARKTCPIRQNVYAPFVMTKTISIDQGAYQLLAAARLSAKESFSQVIKRNFWTRQAKTCGSLLAALPLLPVADEDVLVRLDAAQLADTPPDDPCA